MIGVIGLNHKTASVEVRERFVFDESESERFITDLQQSQPEFIETVLLSTCNRTEIYFNSSKVCEQSDFAGLIRFLTQYRGVEQDIQPHFYCHKEQQAAAHLFRVTAGLNSMVLGENQILGQVKEAYRISSSKKFTHTLLNRLFHKAFEAGKLIRTQTAINEGASSIGYAAIELASKIFVKLSEHPVLLIGAGETAELVLQCLSERGSRHLHITNRTYERAVNLADKYQAEAVPFDRMAEQLSHSDIVITSTASRTPLLECDFLQGVMQKRHNRSIFLIDLSVPRDVAEGIKDLEEVFVYNIDDLEMVVSHNYERRKGEIKKADKIVDRFVREYFKWVDTLQLAPAISQLKKRFEAISQEELANLKNRLNPETYQKVEEYSSFLQGKYLGLIIKNLKELSKDNRRLDYIDLLNNLFELYPRDTQ